MKTFVCFTLIALCTAFVLTGCRDGASEKKAGGATDKQYAVKGKVVSIAEDKKTITLDHEDIPGLMKAMKMTFRIESEKAVEGLRAGDEVQGTLKVSSGEYTIVRLEKK